MVSQDQYIKPPLNGGLTVVKVEHDTSTGAIKTFQQQFLEFQYKSSKGMTLEERTIISTNMKDTPNGDDIADPSSLYKLKPEEVDFGIMKMEEDEDLTSGPTDEEDWEGGEQHGEIYEKNFECIKCEMNFRRKFGLDSHIVAKHNTDIEMMNSVTYKINHCKHCSYITLYADMFLRHMRTHGEKLEKTFDCIGCKKEFLSKLSLDSHIVVWHSDNPEVMKSVSNEIYRCFHCEYITVKKNYLYKHTRMHGRKSRESFDCTKCGKKLSNKFFLDNHIITHHSSDGEMMSRITCKIHRCKLCSYITMWPRSLDLHTRTHEAWKKPVQTFDCINCEKTFNVKRSLHGHIISKHSDNIEMMNRITSKIHRCNYCNYITVSQKYFKIHNMRKHGGKTLYCTTCEKEFLSKRSMDKHIITYHGDNVEMMYTITSKLHRCKHCKYITTSRPMLKKHMRTHEENTLD